MDSLIGSTRTSSFSPWAKGRWHLASSWPIAAQGLSQSHVWWYHSSDKKWKEIKQSLSEVTGQRRLIAAQSDFQVLLWFDITRLFLIWFLKTMWASESAWKVLFNGVGPFTLRLIAWKWQRSKDNCTNLQNTTTTFFCQETSNFNKIGFSQPIF